jgi:hypothetical protein
MQRNGRRENCRTKSLPSRALLASARVTVGWHRAHHEGCPFRHLTKPEQEQQGAACFQSQSSGDLSERSARNADDQTSTTLQMFDKRQQKVDRRACVLRQTVDKQEETKDGQAYWRPAAEDVPATREEMRREMEAEHQGKIGELEKEQQQLHAAAVEILTQVPDYGLLLGSLAFVSTKAAALQDFSHLESFCSQQRLFSAALSDPRHQPAIAKASAALRMEKEHLDCHCRAVASWNLPGRRWSCKRR